MCSMNEVLLDRILLTIAPWIYPFSAFFTKSFDPVMKSKSLVNIPLRAKVLNISFHLERNCLKNGTWMETTSWGIWFLVQKMNFAFILNSSSFIKFFPVTVDKICILSRNNANLICLPAIIHIFVRKGHKLKILLSKNILLIIHMKWWPFQVELLYVGMKVFLCLIIFYGWRNHADNLITLTKIVVPFMSFAVLQERNCETYSLSIH